MTKREKNLLGAVAMVGIIFGAFDFIIKPVANALRPQRPIS